MKHSLRWGLYTENDAEWDKGRFNFQSAIKYWENSVARREMAFEVTLLHGNNHDYTKRGWTKSFLSQLRF
ncbi:hypothetical protein FC85_GL002229 [Lentilactobacillus diolivorans DSM 14421]|uniref:Uncharacterized protein n=1 Tax=Lentilactobacillus diolivorans DSM 14421 TaxID=1423739 RepID=A0A0R1SR94_9LACO|nr:hypothetical protein FC85_GL002229 [Lentilactobacillus diolivorans DSM 14421]